MRLFLVRHAHSHPGEPDELRPLSAEGRRQARELGARLSDARPEVVLSSPLLRARETAAAIAEAAGSELRVDERLAPGATVLLVREAIHEADSDGAVAVVGHQPDCSEIAFALGAGERDFPTAGVVEIDIP